MMSQYSYTRVLNISAAILFILCVHQLFGEFCAIISSCAFINFWRISSPVRLFHHVRLFESRVGRSKMPKKHMMPYVNAPFDKKKLGGILITYVVVILSCSLVFSLIWNTYMYDKAKRNLLKQFKNIHGFLFDKFYHRKLKNEHLLYFLWNAFITYHT